MCTAQYPEHHAKKRIAKSRQGPGHHIFKFCYMQKGMLNAGLPLLKRAEELAWAKVIPQVRKIQNPACSSGEENAESSFLLARSVMYLHVLVKM